MCLKESLATSYEGVGLVEDALQQYYELETLFQHVSRERNFSWFGALITPVPGDDSAPLLSISKKPYKDLIMSNKISVFDFRIYILARLSELLVKAGNISEVPGKVASFLAAFSKRLFEIEVPLCPSAIVPRLTIIRPTSPSSSWRLGFIPLRSQRLSRSALGSGLTTQT